MQEARGWLAFIGKAKKSYSTNDIIMILLHVFEKVVCSEGRPHSKPVGPNLGNQQKAPCPTLHLRQSFSHLGKTVRQRMSTLCVTTPVYANQRFSAITLSYNSLLLFPSLFTLTLLIRFTPFFRATFIYPLRLISRPRNCRDLNH